MKLSKAILLLNSLRKKYGDVEILVRDDNNGYDKEFSPGFEPVKVITTGDGQKHQQGGYVIV